MEAKMINKIIRANEIKKEIAWISSEYTRMFATDPHDLQTITDNDRFHCSILYLTFKDLIEELKYGEYAVDNEYKAYLRKLNDKLYNASLDVAYRILTWNKD